MTKRIISLILSITLVFSVLCPAVHADGSADFGSCSHDWQTPIVHGYSITIPNSDISFGVEFQQCSKCHWYKHDASLFIVSATYYSPLAPDLNGIVPTELITYWCNKYYEVFGKNATAKKYETGGGSAGTGGVGRHPSGYTDTAGTPSISSAGVYTLTLDPIIEVLDKEHCSVTVTGNRVRIEDFDEDYIKSNTVRPIRVYYTATSPSDGKFSVPYSPSQKVYDYYYGGGSGSNSKSISGTSNGALYAIRLKNGVDFSGGYTKLDFYGRASVFQGTKVWFAPVFSSSALPDGRFFSIGGSNVSYAYYHMTFYPLVVQFTPDQVSKKTNITINQNVWNGNIYQDNSTNLTYIYPQYTTINENNETVTNISNNPIIYNNETKQYYTYDTVTNNYYYITYETPTPSPSPDPDPTPTPAPGGDTSSLLDVLVQIRDNMIQGFADIKATLVQGWADLSANFTLAIENLNLNITNIFNKKFPDQSTPETAEPSPSPSPSPEPSPSPTPDPGETPTPTPAPTDKPGNGNTNNFWNFVFPGGSDDGTENGHKGILWALISLLIAVVTFVLGLGSAYSYVFPFLPAGLVTTIHICVLVLLLFAIIKFVRSFL